MQHNARNVREKVRSSERNECRWRKKISPESTLRNKRKKRSKIRSSRKKKICKPLRNSHSCRKRRNDQNAKIEAVFIFALRPLRSLKVKGAHNFLNGKPIVEL